MTNPRAFFCPTCLWISSYLPHWVLQRNEKLASPVLHCDHLGTRKTRTLSLVAHFPHKIHKEGPPEPGCLRAADQTALHGPQSPASLGDTEHDTTAHGGHVLTRHTQEDRGKKSSSHLDWRWGFIEETFLHILSPNKASLSVCGKRMWEGLPCTKTRRRNRQCHRKGSLRTAEEQVSEASR